MKEPTALVLVASITLTVIVATVILTTVFGSLADSVSTLAQTWG